MLDPVSALGLAGSLIQVIDFAAKIVSDSRQIFQSAVGTSVDHNRLQIFTQDLYALSISLEKSSSNSYKECLGNVTEIQRLVATTKATANELLKALEDLSVKGPNKRWQSFRQALRSVWKEKQIRDVERRLESCKTQITTRLVATLRYGTGRTHIRLITV